MTKFPKEEQNEKKRFEDIRKFINDSIDEIALTNALECFAKYKLKGYHCNCNTIKKNGIIDDVRFELIRKKEADYDMDN